MKQRKTRLRFLIPTRAGGGAERVVVIHNPVDRQRILEACSTAPPLPVRRRTRNLWLQCAEIGSHIRRTLRGE